MNKPHMKYVLFIACAFLLSLLTGVPSAGADSPTLPTPRVPAAGQLTFLPFIDRNMNSWPMVGANPERTSWTREEVRGNLSVEWYHPIEPFIPYKVQPIAENDKIYVSTSRGLYAFNSATGNLAWVFPTDLPLGHSPTIAAAGGKSVAFVGGEDHKMYALDAQTGQPLAGYTPFEAGAGFETNPLVINNTVYAGNRDGNFYALDALTGALKWQYSTNGPILFSAAYKNGVVYFASNDSYAYAVNASSGALVWKSVKFPGAGFQTFWPVVYTEKASGKDYVIFTGSENLRTNDTSTAVLWSALHQLDQQYLWGSCWPDKCSSGIIWPTGYDSGSGTYWGHDASTIDVTAITNYYENFPERHTTFALDAASGQEFTFDSNHNGKPEYAPFTWSGVTSSGNKYPGVVNGYDHVYYQDTIYFRNNWISGGNVVGWKWGDHVVSRVEGSTYTNSVDEPMAYSSGGALIYWSLCCDREAGAYDVTIPYGQPNRDWKYWAYNLNNLAPDYGSMYNDGNSSLYTNGNGWQVYSGSSQSKNGVYGKHETAQAPPVPYKGRLYMLRGNALLALSPYPPPGSPTKLALATTVTGGAASSTLNKATLTQRLETEIQKMITAGHLRPGYHSAGFIDIYGTGGFNDERTFGEIFDYFQNPSDTVYTLLLAYPNLSSGTQAQVIKYLQTYYGPGAPYDFTKIVHIGWGAGAQREAYITPAQAYSVWGTPYKSPSNQSTLPICGWCGYWHNFPPFSFYAAWKYAVTVGNSDSTFAANIFNLMSGKIEAPPSDIFLTHKPYFINLYAAGYLGYLQLKQLALLGGDATVQGYYNHMLSLKVGSFSKDTPYWATDTDLLGLAGLDYNRTLSVARNFMFLTPEIGDYMSQNIKSQVQTAVDEYNTVAPYWFVSKFDATIGEGSLDHLYNPPALFQAKAYILKQSYSEMVKWIDAPAFERGDLFYIQNLAAALAAP